VNLIALGTFLIALTWLALALLLAYTIGMIHWALRPSK
jgi:hypothetical protein